MIMISDALHTTYKEARATDSFTVHSRFTQQLLESSDPGVLQLQYDILQDPSNRDLQRIVGNAFTKRGPEVIPFLLDKLHNDPADAHKANVLHVLGLFKKPALLPEVLPYLQSPNAELRYKAIVVTGWIGDAGCIDTLAALLPKESQGDLRGFIGSAMRQIFHRLPATRDHIVHLLVNALKTETNKEGAAIMIVVIQSILKIKFGLKEDPDTGLISGDVEKARTKLLKNLTSNAI